MVLIISILNCCNDGADLLVADECTGPSAQCIVRVALRKMARCAAPTCLVQTRPLANSSRPPLKSFGAGLPSSPAADEGQHMVRARPGRHAAASSGLEEPGASLRV
jgi:hypothetical protein